MACLMPVAAALLAAGCSSNSNSPPAPEPQPALLDAFFVDAQIEGLGFAVASGASGFSDAQGTIKFAEGRATTLFIGSDARGIVLGQLRPTGSNKPTLTPRDLKLADGTAVSENHAVNVLRLLQSLDDDGIHRNGILIKDATRLAASAVTQSGQPIDFNVAPVNFASQSVVQALLNATGRQLPSADQALANFSRNFRQGRSSSIALTPDDRRAVVVNKQKGTVTIFEVKTANGADVENRIVELPVGKEPRYVAITPDGNRALVANAFDGTVSVINLASSPPAIVGAAIAVGTEPRGIAITPNGKYAFVALHTEAAVAVLKLSDLTIIKKLATGGNPLSVAISNDGDAEDVDETVFITRVFGELINPARPDGFNDAKQGVIDRVVVGEAIALANPTVSKLLLKPMNSGFTADRRNFCANTRTALQGSGTVFFNSGADRAGNGAAALANQTFCPDVSSTDVSPTGAIGAVPQLVYPNMLNSVLIRGSELYVANIGASPEPPVRFNVNVQGLIGTINHALGVETASVNLNAQIKDEAAPAAGGASLQKLFMNDVVAIDGDRFGNAYWVVSRGANFVIRATQGLDGALTISAPNVVRLETGNLPSGIAVSADGKRAYTNNELNTSMTMLDLEQQRILSLNANSSEPPAPGTQKHRDLLGKLAFFTALGLPDKLDTNGDGTFDVALRSIRPLDHRNKASDNGWSSCASCHEDGHSDNVSWIFPTGPRQTIPMEGSFALNNLDDQRIFNWSGVQGSTTDFNNNARGIQGGKGFATDVGGQDRSSLAFNHGNVRGVSDSLDAMYEWGATIRAPIMPDGDTSAGRAAFEANCASCHGGKKWTKSQVIYANNPTFQEDPIGLAFFTNGGFKPLDPNLTVAGPQIRDFKNATGRVIKFLDNVGTFLATAPLELRGAGTVATQVAQGFASLGGAGYNTPSLLGLAYSAPYLHDGSANSLDEVFARHKLADGRTISAALAADQLSALKQFALSIDDATPTMSSETDQFLAPSP